MRFKTSILVAAAGLILTTLQPAVTWAEHGSDSTSTSSGQEDVTKGDGSRDTTQIEQRNDALESSHSGKLAGLRLSHCEAKQANIQNIITNATNAGTRHLAVFDAIANRVVAFANANPNLKPTNFDDLVAAISTKRAAAAAAIDVVSKATFMCSSDAPLGQLMAFRATIKDMRASLHQYRLAIKDLIVAIKAKAETETETSSENQ